MAQFTAEPGRCCHAIYCVLRPAPKGADLNEDLCITPFQLENEGRQAKPGVATGQSVLAWRLGYAEVLARQHAQPLGDIRPHGHPKTWFIACF